VQGASLAYKVLIVDDNAVIRRLVRDCIEQDSNWQVCGEAENGKLAVEKVNELCPDIVILDLQMPVMNGLEAARQIKVVAPETAMVMFTMHSSEQLLRDARAVGVKAVLSKPEGLHENLLKTLRMVLATAQREPTSRIVKF
jgi:DNA-binding NarL/FixJ family response regulator